MIIWVENLMLSLLDHAICPHMKKITLPKILDCLENETGEITMDQETIDKARLSVEKMVAIGR